VINACQDISLIQYKQLAAESWPYPEGNNMHLIMR